MTKIIAVSGGVDSVVLLDILARKKHTKTQNGRVKVQPSQPSRLVVAHVDHGIRQESSDDARFVEGLARQYQLPFVSTELRLRRESSEEAARAGRYDFLFAKAKEFDATVLTAHHQDDVIGSIAINLARGTGWRGLAVMNRKNIERPLIGWTKQSIYRYALKNRLEWVEDASNQTDKYLRNRLRRDIVNLPTEVSAELMRLRAGQLQLSRDINSEMNKILQLFGESRYRYGAVEPSVALELLRARFGITTPQAELALLAIKTARPGALHVIGKQLKLRFSKTDFIVENHL